MAKPLLSFFCSILLFVFSFLAQAQSNPIKDTLISVVPDQTYTLPLQKAGAIAVKCESCTFTGSYFLQGKDTLKVVPDPHADQSALLSLENPPETISFYSGQAKGNVQFFFISSGTVKATERKTTSLREGDGACSFEVVPTSAWRAGLAAPTYTRSYTQTKHVAVHHAAGSNTATDHYKVVRDIYLYHRNTNGWSDIGYNYLIAPDGTIFQGRDNPTDTFDDDYVLGAHLCGNNSNAMGICLLGDFTNVLPTQKAMESLYKLIKWKTKKDNIDIFGSTSHAIGPAGYGVTELMPNVLGHRDGCRPGYTACPGNMLYTKMSEIRTNASTFCPPTTVGIPELSGESLAVVYPNPANGAHIRTKFAWKTVEIYTIGGQLVRQAEAKTGQELSIEQLPSGVYLFHFNTPEFGKVVRRVVVN